jgi:hypothetical protein
LDGALVGAGSLKPSYLSHENRRFFWGLKQQGLAVFEFKFASSDSEILKKRKNLRFYDVKIKRPNKKFSDSGIFIE